MISIEAAKRGGKNAEGTRALFPYRSPYLLGVAVV